MSPWPRYLAIAMLALALAACGSAGPPITGNAQAAPMPTNVPPAPPATAKPEPSIADPSPVPTADLNSRVAPASCPVTRPPTPLFTPALPYPRVPPGDMFWHGSDALWTALPGDGVWWGLPDNPEGYTQKILWWHKGYSPYDEPEPNLLVAGRRLDAQAPPLNVSRATNAMAPDIHSGMLVGVDFPTLGCWQITGQYAGAQLSFVVWVAA